jgi:hypothetical protein
MSIAYVIARRGQALARTCILGKQEGVPIRKDWDALGVLMLSAITSKLDRIRQACHFHF